MKNKEEICKKLFEKITAILSSRDRYEFYDKDGNKIAISVWYGEESGISVNGKLVFVVEYDGDVASFTPGGWIETVLEIEL